MCGRADSERRRVYIISGDLNSQQRWAVRALHDRGIALWLKQQQFVPLAQRSLSSEGSVLVGELSLTLVSHLVVRLKWSFGLKSLEMTRVVTVPQCVMLLLGGGLAVHGLTVPWEVYLINFSCLLAHVVVLSAPLLKWPIVCHCELRLLKKIEVEALFHWQSVLMLAILK